MSVYQCWVEQRERLRERLRSAEDTAGATGALRHALAQVEQNAMAEQPDDLLRQQTGILFSCVKGSLGLLDITVATRVWVARAQAEKRKPRLWPWMLAVALGCMAWAGAYAYLRSLWLIWPAVAAAAALGIVGFFGLRRAQKPQPEDGDRLKVTAKPDTDQLFAALDAQMRGIDRYIHDFAYLNEQTALRSGGPDPHGIGALAELMEAIAGLEGEPGEDAAQAAQALLASLGVRALPYAPEAQRFFTVLPSVSGTRTLAPALVSSRDGALLQRGTAAVAAPGAPAAVPDPAVQDAPEGTAAAAEPSAPLRAAALTEPNAPLRAAALTEPNVPLRAAIHAEPSAPLRAAALTEPSAQLQAATLAEPSAPTGGPPAPASPAAVQATYANAPKAPYGEAEGSASPGESAGRPRSNA